MKSAASSASPGNLLLLACPFALGWPKRWVCPASALGGKRKCLGPCLRSAALSAKDSASARRLGSQWALAAHFASVQASAPPRVVALSALHGGLR